VLPGLLLALVVTAGSVGHASAQERTHTVVRGNTLWDLAAAVYGDPFRWPRIFEANRDRVQDPDLIFPGQVLRIPMADGTVTEVTVVTGGDPRAEEAPPAQPVAGEPGQPAVAGARLSGGQAFDPAPRPARPDHETLARSLPAVPDDLVASAPFIVPAEGDVPALGRVAGYAGAEEIRAPRSSARLYDRMVLEADAALPVGTWLQAFKVDALVPGLGRVAHPTGLLEVEPAEGGSPVARLRVQYGALHPGDRVRAVPRGGLAPGVRAVAVAGGPEAVLAGVAREHALQSVGDFVFLDVGRDVTSVGDEWVPVWEASGEGPPEGRVQIVAVQDGVATGRIVNLVNPVFAPGITLQLDRRMPRR
jgi:hypothetical protein